MVQCRYTNGYREYLIGGGYIPSVTSVISALPKPYIKQWKKKHTEEQIEAIMKYSSTRGTMIHYNALQQYCNQFITQEPPDFSDIQYSIQNKNLSKDIQTAMVLFKEFQSVFTLEPVAIERVIHNYEIGYAGRLDFQGFLVIENEQIPVLVDIKSGAEVYKDDASLQLTAYNKALDNFAERLYILLLHPGPTTIKGAKFGGTHAYWSFVRVKPDWKKFIETLELFQQLKDQKQYTDYSEWME